MNKKILIQTALGLEFKAVRAFISDIFPDFHPVTNSIYDRGSYRNGQSAYEVLLCETAVGNNRASDETSRALEYFSPDYAFFVGVAGGLKDVRLGDVVAATKVIGYEFGKDEAGFMPRNDVLSVSYRLEQISRRLAREAVWQKKIRSVSASQPNAIVAPIASADIVVASTKSASYQTIRQNSGDAVAVDMEGIGFLVASRPYDLDAIVIRGISDLIDKKGETDQSGSQPLAVANAAAFTFAIIDELYNLDAPTPDIGKLETRRKLVDALTRLYPQGPEQSDIWARAGGDVSILVNAMSRESQWFSAIEKLSLGGGGSSITLKTLLDEVTVDFPNAALDFG
jgi:nucleoside phosphorylase